ncbi:MAG: ABC transporter substrate-binding protein [Sulfolobales archaeon]
MVGTPRASGLIKRTSSPVLVGGLIAFLVLASAAHVLLVNSQQEVYANIFDYIKREPWMVPGGTLRIPMMAEAGTLNPLTFTTSWEAMIIDNVYDTLVILTPDMKFAGRLAKSWELLPDGKTWVFHLFENARWHDGSPVTARDVEFTYNLLARVGNKTRWAGQAVLIEKAEAVDDYTVKIYLKQPYAPFLLRIAERIYILPEHIWSNIEDVIGFKNENPVGSGPFVFVEHVPQQYFKLKANLNYHLGRPLVDEVVLPIISDPDAMLLAFSKGEIDSVTWSIPYASIDRVKAIPEARIHAVTEYGARFMYFNCQRYPTNVTLFRQAVHHLINITEVVEVIYLGYALPGSLGRLPPSLSPWANQNLPPKEVLYPFSLDKAKQLLDRMGLKDVDGDGWRETPAGEKLKLTIYSPVYDPLRVRWADIIASNLRAVGINVEHQPLEWTTLVAKLDSGDFDMLVIGGIGDLDPDILYDLFHTNGGWNNGKCSFPDLDELLEKQRFETDVSERIRLVWEIQVKLAEYVPLLNAVHQQFLFAYRTDNFDGWVLGPFMSPDNFFSYMNLYSVKLAKKPETPTPTPIATPTTTPPTPITTPTPTTTPISVSPTPTPTPAPVAPAADYTWAIVVALVIVALIVAASFLVFRRR